MKRSNLMTKLSAWMLGVFLCLGSLTAYATHDLGVFELDGNALDGDGSVPILQASPDDWESLHLGYGNADVFTGVTSDPAPMDIFTGGRKDIQEISQWAWKDGAVPDKSDITDAYAAAYNHDGDMIVYFGADRFANVGDTFLGFWFFKGKVVAEPDGSFSGAHQNGDTLVLVNFPQAANAQPLVQVVIWDDSCSKADSSNPGPGDCAAKNLQLVAGQSGAGAICGSNANDLVCAITNDEGGSNDPTASPWPYVPKAGANDIFPYESFFEGGINLTALVGGGCFSSFMAETRSSSSFTAALKDFVLDEFDVCSTEAGKFCDAEFSQTVGSIDVNFNGYVENSGLLPLEITVDDDMGPLTVVCEYTGSNDPPLATDQCGNGDTADLTHDITNGDATFVLGAGKYALYGGSYVESNPDFDSNTGEFVLEDMVTVTATEVGETALIDSEFPEAECRVPGLPGIDIAKSCSESGISNGDTSNFSITGSGNNTGDILLTDVTLSDTVLIGNGAIAGLTILVDGSPVSNGFDLPAGSSYSYTATAAHTDGLQHQNSMSVTAMNPFTGQAIPVLASHTATTVVCSNTALPDIAVTKVCEVFLDSEINPGQITVGVRISGTVENTGNIDLSNVDVDDRDAEVVAEVGQLVSNASLPVGSGPQNYGPFTYYPSSSETEPGAGGLGFTNTVDAFGTPALNLPEVSDTATSEQCLLCPQ